MLLAHVLLFTVLGDILLIQTGPPTVLILVLSLVGVGIVYREVERHVSHHLSLTALPYHADSLLLLVIEGSRGRY